MSKDERVDAYIARQADFARPILEHLRATVHAACPECEEAMKWSMPAFLYKGKQLAGMAAFKAHATFGFWQRSGERGEESKAGAMGDFGRLTNVADLPDDLAAALRASPAAQTTYDGFPPGCRREYLEWVTSAKRPETRSKRIAEAVQMMAEGKKRNWKYEGC